MVLSTLDVLIMNHMLGPNTPLLRVQLPPSTTLTLEHIVGAKIAASLHLSVTTPDFDLRDPPPTDPYPSHQHQPFPER